METYSFSRFFSQTGGIGQKQTNAFLKPWERKPYSNSATGETQTWVSPATAKCFFSQTGGIGQKQTNAFLKPWEESHIATQQLVGLKSRHSQVVGYVIMLHIQTSMVSLKQPHEV